MLHVFEARSLIFITSVMRRFMMSQSTKIVVLDIHELLNKTLRPMA
jgi:hypothetical protein